MKILRASLLPAAFALLAVCSATAQTISDYGFAYTVDYTQTSSGTPTLNADPYHFTAFVEGEDLHLGSPYTLSHSGSATSPQTLPTTGIYRNFESTGFASVSALNTAYSGPFSMNIDGTTVTSLSLSGDLFPITPVISGGVWSGGKLLVAAGSSYSLAFNSYGSGASFDNVELYIDFTPGIGGVYDDQSSPGNAVGSLLIPGGTFVAGNTYNAELIFSHRPDTDDGVSIAGAFGFTAYATALNFQIQAVSAIPEPSTYAAIAGAAALGLVVWRRRRTVA